jgi:hypothetical protein
MYRKKLLYLILIATLVRLLIGGLLELGNDEVYYYTYALHLQPNYFDHPPAIAYLIRAFTFNLAFQQEIFVRLGAIVFAAIGTWLSYYIGKTIKNERTGWYAAVLYTTSIYTSIIAGTFILPDSPQVVCWLAALYYMLQVVQDSIAGQRSSVALWILVGLFNGLCIMCKVHGIFLWGGFGLYMLFYNRKLFAAPGLYLSLLLTALIISPILLWNIQNNFVTWNYHSERVEVRRFALDTDSFLQTLLGQIFYNSPINVILVVITLLYLRHNHLLQRDVKVLLLFCGLPMIGVVTIIALFKSVLPHWSGPGFMTLNFMAASYLDRRVILPTPGKWPRLLKGCMGLIVVVVAGGMSLVRWYPGTIGNKEKASYGEGDFTLDMYGWSGFGASFKEWFSRQEQTGELVAGMPIVCNKWFPAAHIEYYVGRHINSPVLGIGELNDLHHYAWLNTWRPALKRGADALCIVPSNYPENPLDTYRTTFDSAVLLHSFTETRGGKVTRYFSVYRLKSFKGEGRRL